jgi:hypothetical protein
MLILILMQKRSLVESVKADIRMQAGLTTRIWQQLGLFEATDKTIKKAILDAQLDDLVGRIRVTMQVGFHSNGGSCFRRCGVEPLYLLAQSSNPKSDPSHRCHVCVAKLASGLSWH